MGSKDADFEYQNREVEGAAYRVQNGLCDDRHERKEGARPVDREEYPVWTREFLLVLKEKKKRSPGRGASTNPNDLALPFPDFEIRGEQPYHEEDGRNDTDQENWPFCSTVIYRAEGKD